MSPQPVIEKLNELIEGSYYKLSSLQAILKRLGLNHSIYTIRDYETWKCLNYKCGKRYGSEISTCPKCNADIRAPLIISPRTMGGGKGPGHRRYSAEEIRKIVELFTQRK